MIPFQYLSLLPVQGLGIMSLRWTFHPTLRISTFISLARMHTNGLRLERARKWRIPLCLLRIWIRLEMVCSILQSWFVPSYSRTAANIWFSGVTLSPRISTDETEPSYSSSINVETLSGTVANGTISVNGRCTNCTKWNKGSLDLKSTNQAFIYGLGPSSGSLVKLQSNSLSANLERHSVYGK